MSSGVLFLATCCSTLQEPEGSFQCRKLFALCFRFLLSDVWEQIENRDSLGKITFFYKNNKAIYSEYKNIFNLFDDLEF